MGLKYQTNTSKLWGFVDPDGVLITLPKVPMLLAELGPPPFSVTLPSGEVRHIVECPENDPSFRPETESTDEAAGAIGDDEDDGDKTRSDPSAVEHVGQFITGTAALEARGIFNTL